MPPTSSSLEALVAGVLVSGGEPDHVDQARPRAALRDRAMLLNPRPELIKRIQLVPAATVEPLRDPEPVEEPQVDVVHRSGSIGSPARPLETFP
jgi:hypothetical protein